MKDKVKNKIITNKMSKRGFIKTLEMLLAVSITFTFLMFLIPQLTRTETEEPEFRFLEVLIENSAFRESVLSENNASLNSSILNALREENLQRYNYTFTVSSDPNFVPRDLPDKKITILSAVISANNTLYMPKTIRIYLWKIG